MNTSDKGNIAGRRRRTHSASFKAKVVAACGPGVSIAAVALVNGLNANLLRRWVRTENEEAKSSEAATALPAPASIANRAFIPIEMEGSAVHTQRAITIELRRGATVVKVDWPVTAAADCAAWLRELLR